MDTALTQKFPFILDRNLAKANCTGNRVCTSCDTVVLVLTLFSIANIHTSTMIIMDSTVTSCCKHETAAVITLRNIQSSPFERFNSLLAK